MNSYNLKDIENILNNAHPKQITNEVGNIHFTLYEVNYEYTTIRNNRKKGKRYFLLNTLSPQVDMKEKFYNWVREYNQNNKHRQLSNEKFLDSQCLGFLNI